MIKKNLSYLLIAGFFFTAGLSSVLANDITILYTGDTHAMLYPCSCPKESDGGVSRRATLIKELRQNNPGMLVLDSGGFFAAGVMDEYSQNTQLDMERTLANLKAIELIQYDALAVGDNEFNFGREFLETNIPVFKLNFLCANIKSDKLMPYLIKEVSGVKVGIFAIASVENRQKFGEIELTSPALAAKETTVKLKQQSVDLIVVLSGLSENENLQLARNVEGINIIISAYSQKEPAKDGVIKAGSVLIVNPFWQGRSLGKLSLTLKGSEIEKYKLEKLRISAKIAEDKKVLAVIPQCYSDANCKNNGVGGICQKPGTLEASCKFDKPNNVPLLVIIPKDCLACDTKRPVDFLKKYFPGLNVGYIYYPSRRAGKLIKDLGIRELPVYLLDKNAQKENDFNRLLDRLEKKGDFYMLNPRFAGFSYFLGRKKEKGKLDLFISLFDKNSSKLLEVIREFNPRIHFLVSQNQEAKFDAKAGNLEVEECLRSACIDKYYPQVFWDYLACRTKNIYTSWWDDCLTGIDKEKIKVCAQGKEGQSLLRENTVLNKELGVIVGPAYLIDNQEIFGSVNVPTKEEFNKIIKR